MTARLEHVPIRRNRLIGKPRSRIKNIERVLIAKPAPTFAERALGAAILAGGAASRMGEDKALQLWAGERAVDLVVALACAAGAAHIVTVGGGDYGWPRVADAEPLAGPVGGILAGAAALDARGCAAALILAVDSPTIRLADIAPLLAAPPPGAAFAGLHLPMLVALSALPADAEAGWPVRRLIERAGLARPTCPPEALARLRGANTPEERARLLAGRS